MGVTEDLADELARDVIKFMEATDGDEQIIADIKKVLGASSQTAEEAFLTAIRVRRANIKARALLVERAREFKARKAGDSPPE
ncbi:hypothetical protein K1T73_10075 [Roseovarius sp. SCSIO 43702]|uniref:hypothetical protein n=1 Tax=Roseovarius sp. SCSIO 43702 TaxID=2823043 RepID=UPI001C73B750|nr:hypothetical protein [Roseovarius sp. SCSIO 43702]QYX55456.1 hypothetical protein K1T73_10075 [Roseovarius sp. SCSIO 43702]